MSDNLYSTLSDIRIKVRKLTRSPSINQISDAVINDYINTFVLYDFPEHLRMFYLRTTLTFYTSPYIDTYTTNTTNVNDPLYNFKNQYISTGTPVYIAGFPAYYTQSREQFYNIYPIINSISTIGSVGDGVTTNFTGTLSAVPVLAGKVTFSSVDFNNDGLALADDGNGNLLAPGFGATTPASTINYITGDYVLNFPFAPGVGVAINSMTVPYAPSRPQGICFFQDSFIVRPVPDQPYPINLEVFTRPTELLSNNQMPDLAEWWQYIAYGAAKKILEDRMDPDTVAIIMPEFKKQETMMLRRSLVQMSNERTATIFTEQTSIGNGFNWGGYNF
jgi:hypothetical protein